MEPTSFLFDSNKIEPALLTSYEEVLSWLQLRRPEANLVSLDPELAQLHKLLALLRLKWFGVRHVYPMEPSPLIMEVWPGPGLAKPQGVGLWKG